MAWAKSIIHWQDNGRVFISVAFTWHLPKAKTLASWYKQAGAYVYIGGPAVDLMPEYVRDVADQVGGELYPLPLKRHNPDATFTSRGCINQCAFCAVPKIEGGIKELRDWVPAPIVCDNNILATTKSHFDHAIDQLKPIKGVDFNQGLDARLLNTHHVERLQELALPVARFAFDQVGMESKVMDAIDRVIAAGFPRSRVRCYVLFGFNDQLDDAMYRMLLLRNRGIRPSAQRFQPIQGGKALIKNSHVAPGWTHRELQKFQRYWTRQNWFSKLPYDEFMAGMTPATTAGCP